METWNFTYRAGGVSELLTVPSLCLFQVHTRWQSSPLLWYAPATWIAAWKRMPSLGKPSLLSWKHKVTSFPCSSETLPIQHSPLALVGGCSPYLSWPLYISSRILVFRLFVSPLSLPKGGCVPSLTTFIHFIQNFCIYTWFYLLLFLMVHMFPLSLP